MPKHNFRKKAQCPFYKGEYRMEIFCEGLIPDSSIHQGYANPALMNDYIKEFCTKDYERCPVAQMLNKKYEQE